MCTRSEHSAMRLSSEKRLLTLADLDLRHSQRDGKLRTGFGLPPLADICCQQVECDPT